MAAPTYFRSPFSLVKRLRIAPPVQLAQSRSISNYQSRLPFTGQDRSMDLEHSRQADEEFDDYMSEVADHARGNILPLREFRLPGEVQKEINALRLPRSVQATYLAPLKHTPKHDLPAADLQLRSYSVRNLELMADFALRAAYYLNLAAKGPVPLPRITERWTVPRGNFVHKKSQENFERITLRRLIQVRDGHPETVQIWLGFLQKYCFYGVGMKANVWEHTGVNVAQDMEKDAKKVEAVVQQKLSLFGRRKDLVGKRDTKHLVHDSLFKGAYGAGGVMGSQQYRHV